MHRKYQMEANGVPLGDDVEQISPVLNNRGPPNNELQGSNSRQLYPNSNFGGGQPPSSNLYDIQRVPSPSGGLRSIQRVQN